MNPQKKTLDNSKDTFIHLFSGGTAGTIGAIVTCPLEVVKTRMQSSHNTFEEMYTKTAALRNNGKDGKINRQFVAPNFRGPMGLIQCIKHIIDSEGPRSLFKGLGPNIVGVAPSRAIYFCSYSQSKKFFNDFITPDSPVVHIISASFAGFAASSCTNPIWFVKTRLQLDKNKNGRTLTAYQCVRSIYNKLGILGFYKGITASYFGITETVIHFVIYEALKAELILKRVERRAMLNMTGEQADARTFRDFVEFMAAGALSKTIASTAAYPHEVARTRLREEGTKYRKFWQTLALVYEEEGYRGLYRGLSIQLLRQIPNTAVMMATYEAVVYLLTNHFQDNDSANYLKKPD